MRLKNRPGKRHWLKISESGAAAVEFAFVIPLLLLVVCGIFDFGNLYYNMDVVNQAARQGARLAAVNLYTQAQTTSAIQTAYPGYQLTVSESPAAPVATSNVTVTVTTNVTFLTPIISAFFSKNPFPVSGTCVMYVE